MPWCPCSCKRELTFGELVDAWLKAGSPLARSVPRGFLSVALARVATKPLCSLYLPAAAPGFAGHCDAALPKACSDSDRLGDPSPAGTGWHSCVCRAG